MLRYKLRTLLILLAVGPPLLVWSCRAWMLIDWQAHLRPTVAERRIELEFAKGLDNGSNLTKAGVRHAELRYKREDARARKDSALYRTLVPAMP
jgi:hypothetical protein